jgi:hypothetical protein
MWLSYYAPYPSLSAANGQWIGLTRKAYDQIGGHQAVQRDLVEDVALARLVKHHQLKILTATGKGTVFGHMYDNWTEVINGFSKNAFGLTDFNALLYFCLLILMFGAHVLPYLLWITPAKYWALGMIIQHSAESLGNSIYDLYRSPLLSMLPSRLYRLEKTKGPV